MEVAVSHVNADFDSLGSLVGAGLLYPGAALVLPGGESAPVRSFLALHKDVLTVRTPADIDPETITRVVVVDTCSRRRLGPAAEWLDLPDVEVHLYDHHPGEDCDIQAEVQRLEPWGSGSSILALEALRRGLTPTPVQATAMLLGIYEDTGSLSYSGTRPEDLEAAAWLLRMGGDLDVVAEYTHGGLTAEQRELLRQLLAAVEIREVHGVPIAFATAPPGAYVEGAAGLANRILEAEEVPAAFVLAPMQDTLYVIGRSITDAVDVGAALRRLGGGGHPRAASASIRNGDPEEVRERLLAALDRAVAPEPTARQIMSYPVRTVSPDTPIAEARRRMIRYGHSGLLVVEDGKLVGVVTRRDVDKARHHRLEHSPVRGVMTRHVRTITPDTPLSQIEQEMTEAGIGRLPVMRGDEILGLVTRTDLLRALHGKRYLAGSRPAGEEPVVQLLKERLPARIQLVLEETGRIAEAEGARVYAVGGMVRDLLLNVRNTEVDLLVEPNGIALARAVAARLGGEVTRVDAPFGTAKVLLGDDLPVDFATARTESYAQPGALPEVEPSSVSDDLRRRDFTINAMAIALNPGRFGELLDPFGGRADLERRRIRALHNLSFPEDPTRLFRAVRFEERFNFRMDAHTEELAREAVAAGALARITPERQRAEWYRTFREAKPLGAIFRLEDLGVHRWLAPGLELNRPLLQAVPGALQWWRNEEREAVSTRLVYLSAMLFPLGAEAAREVAEQKLRIPPPDLRRMVLAIQTAADPEALRMPPGTPASVTRRLEGVPPEGLVLLRAAVMLREDAEGLRKTLERFVDEWRKIKLEVTGHDLKALGYEPGPKLGEALRAALDARRNGELPDRAAELEFIRARLDDSPPPGQ